MKPKYKLSSIKSQRALPLAVGFALVGAVASAQAQDTLKPGVTGTINYTNVNIWNDGTVPTATDDVVFDRSNAAPYTAINFGTSGAQNANSITFGSATGPALGAFAFRGASGAARTLNITTGNITVDSSVAGTISFGQSSDANANLNTAASGFTLTNNSTTQTLNAVWKWQAGKDMTFSTAGGAINLDRNAPGWTGNLASLNGGSSATSIVNSAAAGASVLTLNGTGSHSFAGIIKDGASATNALTINGATLNQTLSGASTYTGGTTVTAGTLLANNITGSATGTATVTVNGGTLGGTGSISGAVTVNTTGFISPGASIESLATGALTLNTGSTFAYELNTSAGTGDLLDVNGDLDLNGTVTLNLADLGTSSLLAIGTKFTLVSYFGAWTPGDVFNGFADDSTFTLFGNDWQINYNDTSAGSVNGGAFGNAVTLTTIAIPEPSAAVVLLGLGVMSQLRRRRK
jgi:autotransporter-associated beta strand protein